MWHRRGIATSLSTYISFPLCYTARLPIGTSLAPPFKTERAAEVGLEKYPSPKTSIGAKENRIVDEEYIKLV